jgi:hypothetical protein
MLGVASLCAVQQMHAQGSGFQTVFMSVHVCMSGCTHVTLSASTFQNSRHQEALQVADSAITLAEQVISLSAALLGLKWLLQMVSGI